MDGRFPGTLSLSDGEALEAEIVLEEDVLTLSSSGARIGTWPLRHCAIRDLDASTFSLVLDGEPADFAPRDPEQFALAAAASFAGSSLAERVNVIRKLPGALAQPEEGQRDDEGETGRGEGRRHSLVLAAGAALVVAVVAWSGFDPSPAPVQGAPAPTSTTIAPGHRLFELSPSRFAQVWNDVAGRFDAPVEIGGRLPPGDFETTLTPRLILQGTVAQEGTLARVILTADPAGTPEEDEVIMGAWGVAIAVGSPHLDGAERRRLLTELGLDVDAPQLGGLEGEVEVDGVLYSLRYLPEFSRVLFTLSPA